MASLVNNWIEDALVLREVIANFEETLKSSLKEELLKVAEKQIDEIIDNTIKKLETRIDSMHSIATMESFIKIIVQREGKNKNNNE